MAGCGCGSLLGNWWTAPVLRFCKTEKCRSYGTRLAQRFIAGDRLSYSRRSPGGTIETLERRGLPPSLRDMLTTWPGVTGRVYLASELDRHPAPQGAADCSPRREPWVGVGGFHNGAPDGAAHSFLGRRVSPLTGLYSLLASLVPRLTPWASDVSSLRDFVLVGRWLHLPSE